MALIWFISLLLFLNFAFLQQTFGWPDGAPCIHAAYESMNPLEAVEHQGGLQLTEPPFQIELDRKCYWLNQPIGLQLKGNTTKTKFKGFQIQPIVWKGSKFGQRIGSFVRLDDNGSWQFQCFRKKDSITHSHDEPKIQMKMWWKNNDDDTQYVQFVATVVVNLKKFWVKSVVSPPLPPCKMEREVGPWAKPIPREPPIVNQFKMDTWRIFNHESSGTFPRSIANFNDEDGSFKAAIRARTEKPFVPITRPTPAPAPVAPVFVTVAATMAPAFQNPPLREISGDVSMNRQPFIPPQTRPPPPPPQPLTTRPPPIQTIIPSQTARPVFQVQPRPQPQPQPQPQQRQRLTHIIPLPNMEMNRRTLNPVPSFSQSASSPALVTIAPTRMIASQRQQQQQQFQRMMQLNREIAMRRQQQQQLQQQQQFRQQGSFCVDRDPPGRCFGWIDYCGRNRYMEINCRRTCRMC
uniref:Reelin domain-containing protein n=1 Tax=Panagrolaimus sp. ES5 TaxID=591445 RepID=A0AC34FIR4_9BILA